MNLNYLLNNTLSADLAIDIGTETTLIYARGKGIVLKEPSYIAYNLHRNSVEEVGMAAKEMEGKAPKCIKVIKPIQNGVISDYEMTAKMLKRFIASVCGKTLLKPRIVANFPSGATVVEQRALCDVLREAGARNVYLLEAPLAAAVGAGCDISLARGMLIVDIGAGESSAASISVGASVIKKSIPIAGNAFDTEIIKYAKKTDNIIIGNETAQKTKHEIGCVCPFDKTKTMSVSGCDAASGLPRSVILTSEELRDVLCAPVKKIAEMIKSVLEDTPPALQADITEDGILIIGGGAKLFGIEKFLKAETGLKVFITENMDECVVLGTKEELIKLDNNHEKNYCISMADAQ